MSEMIERVANAIDEALLSGALEDNSYLGERSGDKVLVDGDLNLVALARAAVQAMRDAEPTEEMMAAMWSLTFANTRESFTVCWSALLDAALLEKEKRA